MCYRQHRVKVDHSGPEGVSFLGNLEESIPTCSGSPSVAVVDCLWSVSCIHWWDLVSVFHTYKHC